MDIPSASLPAPLDPSAQADTPALSGGVQIPEAETTGRISSWTAWWGGPVQRRLARWSAIADQVEALEPGLLNQADAQLHKHSLSLRYRAKAGEPLERLAPEAFALVREAARRTLGMRHFRVQLLGGLGMCQKCISEMETGEGKTLTATLPLYLHALSGSGSHLATVNDYLAERDATWMNPVFTFLGIAVGTVLTPMDQPARRAAYACDITYGTAKEFGFDFLRDRLLLRRLRDLEPGFLGGGAEGEKPVQRAPHFCLVDEADSVLIDEARTPLIISALPGPAQERAVACFHWASENAAQFEEDVHYEYDHEKKTIELTAEGRGLTRSLAKPEAMDAVGLIDIYEYIERSIKVTREFEIDRDYVVRNGEIVIVDESTGRLAEGRKWRDGIHQAIEAKEQVKIGVPTGQAARVTVQDYFLRYPMLGGMTGTASTSAREIRKIYRLTVVPIPTNRPSRRDKMADRVFATGEEKWLAIVNEIQQVHATGRPLLIGTRSIDKSLLLSRMLTDLGIRHEVLNAHKVAEEAEIVACAGEVNKVTVATNMAGRGTDIRLSREVESLGGLHVLCTELHNSARIDRQLIGRCGRQGDRGSAQQYMALDDDVLTAAYGPKKAARIAKRYAGGTQLDRLARLIRAAQRRVERQHLKQRTQLLYHERQRKKMQLEMGHDPYLNTPD